jgi:hypothetical protein
VLVQILDRNPLTTCLFIVDLFSIFFDLVHLVLAFLFWFQLLLHSLLELALHLLLHVMVGLFLIAFLCSLGLSIV